MSRTLSNRLTLLWPTATALVLVGAARHATAQTPANAITSSEISTSSSQATLRLRLPGDRALALALDGGRVRLNGDDIGSYEPGEALDRSWRDLLDAATSASADELPALLVSWEAPAEGAAGGERLDDALEAALVAGDAQQVAPAAPAPPAGPAPLSDSLSELQDRIAELQDRLGEVDEGDQPSDRLELRGLPDRIEIEREVRRELERELRRADGGWFSHRGPLHSVWRGLGGIFSTLAIYAVLVGLGFATVFFGRRYLEGVADTARHATLRSWLVGLAASFLACPVFILGIIALAVSILGIPLLLAWVPLFPVAIVVALLFGYLAVAHGAGEALAERRFHGGDWFKRANSYYYILTGVGLLLALFVASHVVQMAGPWLGFIHGLLMFLAVVLTWAAFTIGLGAVLISRGGTQPVRSTATDEPAHQAFEEESHV